MNAMYQVYLSGKIRNISYEAGTCWRDQAIGYLESASRGKIEVLDPMRNKGFLEGSEAMPRESDDFFAQAQNIFARDIWDVRHADIVLVDLREGNGRFTMFELGMAYALHIPIVLVTDDRFRDDSVCLQYAPIAILPDPESACDLILSMMNCKV